MKPITHTLARARRTFVFASAVFLSIGAAGRASAQSVLLKGGSTLRVQVAPSAKVTVPVLIDMSAGAGTNLASLTTGVTFGTTKLTFDSVRTGGFGSLTSNTTNAASGSLTLSTFDASGTTSSVTMANLYFTASASTGGTTVSFGPTAAGNDVGQSILSLLRVQNLDVCVASSGLWGDVNGDNVVNIIDAQQIARSSVSLSVANPALVASQGDVTNDGAVNIIDAQQIARYTVGLSAAARVNTAVFVAPTIASVTLSGVPGSAMAVGASAQLSATPKDGSNAAQNGCVPVTWSSNNTAVATVDSTGRVVAVSNGSATISATAGGQTATASITVGSTPGAPSSIQVLAGADIWNFVNSVAPVAPTVRVKDANGTGVPNVAVTFTANGGTFNGGNPLVVNTDANGDANAGAGNWTSPSTGGATMTLTASVGGAVTNATMTMHTALAFVGKTTCVYDFWAPRCWGEGTRGELGNGGNASSLTPVNVTNTAGIQTISNTGQNDFFCGFDSAHHLYCWGANDVGQLGDGTRTDRNVPTLVTGGLTWTAIGTGGSHACGVTSAGDVYCWGVNVFGQLGNGTRGTSETTPVKASTPAGVQFQDVVAGLNHTCALTTTNDVYCWGRNQQGQLGLGTISNTPVLTPTLVPGGLKFGQISSAGYTTCGVIVSVGTPYCWGLNGNGQLGNLSTSPSGTPVQVQGGHQFYTISVAPARVCGTKISPDLSTWCWGGNGGGLGDGTTTDRPLPTLIPYTVTTLFQGSVGQTVGTTCGLGPGGQQVYCWGANDAGQVGDGTTTMRTSPTLIPRAGAAAGTPMAMHPQSITMNPQTAPAGTAVAIAPAVVVKDGLGNVIANATVNWTVLSGAGQVVNATSQTDVNGVATSGGWTLGSGIGTQTMQATVSGVVVGGVSRSLRTTFVAFSVNAPASITKTGGDSIYVGGINITSSPLASVVRVADGSNAGVANVPVTFTLGANSGTLSGGTAAVTILTGPNGYAALDPFVWNPNAAVGSVSTVSAAVNGLPAVTFVAFRAPTITGLTSCELTSTGAARCTGVGANGSLGTGSTTNAFVFTAVSGGLTFSQMSGGTAPHRCALTSAGAAYCWGPNAFGQLGDGTTTDRTVPTAVSGGLTFTQIVAQGNTSCGLTSAGAVYCWGWTGTAGWGLGETDRGRIHRTPTLVTMPATPSKIALLDDGLCGLASGNVYCLGNAIRGVNGDGSTAQKTAFSQWSGGPYTDIAAGNIHACALNAAGQIYCVGTSQAGALGDGNTTTNIIAYAPQLVPGSTGYANIAVGNIGACARKTNGDTYCWGNNGTGQAGVGFTGPVGVPTQVAGFQFTSIHSTAFRTFCGKVSNGLVYCWGQNDGGQTGDGTSTSPRTTPVSALNWPDGPPGGTAAGMIAMTNPQPSAPAGLALTPAPSVFVRDRLGAGVAGVTVTFSADPGNGVVTGGTVVTDANGMATVGSWTLPSTVGVTARLTAATSGLASVVFNATTTVAPASITIANGNDQWMPDFNTNAQALSVTVKDANNAVMPNLTVTWTVGAGSGTVAGGSSTYTTTNSNGVALVSNWAPPTAMGTAYTMTATAPGLAPVTFTFHRLGWGANGTSNPNQSICRLTSAGAAYCWGGNGQGQVGDGTTTNRTVPTAVAGGYTFTSLATGASGIHQCGIVAGGQAVCWGNNAAGQLGDGTQTDRSTPVVVSGGLAFSSLYIGFYETCGITTGGAVYCWGLGSNSHRGDGELFTIRTAPTLVNTGGKTFTSITVGLRAICGLDASGQAFCWGENFGGQVGNGTTVAAPTAVATNTALRFTKLAAGFDHTCGLTTGATVACWGYNANGVIGNGTTTNQTSPLVVAGISGATALVAGESHNCVVTGSGAVSCWGTNPWGQLGDGTTTNRTSPVVSAPGFTPTGLMSSSRFTSCATTASQLYCWGGSGGGVGDGAGANRTWASAVRWPESSTTEAASLVPNGAQLGTVAAGANITVFPQLLTSTGAAFPGAAVSFVVTAGGGTLTAASGTTDSLGKAGTTWTVGGSSGTVNRLEVRVNGVPTLTYVFTIQ